MVLQYLQLANRGSGIWILGEGRGLAFWEWRGSAFAPRLDPLDRWDVLHT